jgi:hypothetical protein
MTKFLVYPSLFSPVQAQSQPVAPTEWFAPFSEPRKIVIAAAVLAASGAVLAPQPIQAAPTAPSFDWFQPLSLPGKAPAKNAGPQPQTVLGPQVAYTFPFAQLSTPLPKAAKFYQTAYDLPQQAIAAPVAAPQGWYTPLSQPLFRPQSVNQRSARLQSVIYSFAVPTAPPAAPAMAFFRPLSEPFFKAVKYAAVLQYPSWQLPAAPIWTPVNPASGIWTPATANSQIWTPQLPGTTTWTNQ